MEMLINGIIALIASVVKEIFQLHGKEQLTEEEIMSAITDKLKQADDLQIEIEDIIGKK